MYVCVAWDYSYVHVCGSFYHTVNMSNGTNFTKRALIQKVTSFSK